MDTSLKEQFQQAYKDFDLLPLVEPEQIERLRVDYGLSVLIRLQQEIEASKLNGKFVFVGHRGCGKSTLLKRLAVALRPQHHVAFFSVADELELSAVSHINILYVIALRLLTNARDLKLNIPSDVIATITQWNQQRTQTQGTETTTGGELEASLGLISLKLQREKLYRDELEITFAQQLSVLVDKIDRLAATIQSQTQKPVLVIIDDLDKLDLPLIESIYRQNIKSLFSPGIRVVFTIPVAAIREPQIMGAISAEGAVPYTFPVAKFFSKEQRHDPDAQPDPNSPFNLFLKMLDRRIPTELLEPETAQSMVLKSGGVLRELVRLGRECCTECLVNLAIAPEMPVKIDREILQKAERNLRNGFSRQIGGNSYEILRQVYQEAEPEDSDDEDFVDLLHGLMVLEYENDSLWYDIHPIVLELLKQKQLVV